MCQTDWNVGSQVWPLLRKTPPRGVQFAEAKCTGLCEKHYYFRSSVVRVDPADSPDKQENRTLAGHEIVSGRFRMFESLTSQTERPSAVRRSTAIDSQDPIQAFRVWKKRVIISLNDLRRNDGLFP